MFSSVAKLAVIAIFIIIVIGGGFAFYQIIQQEFFTFPVETKEDPVASKSIVGQSVEGRNIEVYEFPGAGQARAGEPIRLLFVGGIHGGYEWNSVMLAYQFIDYFSANPLTIPENISVSIIPSANPDGLFEVVEKANRFSLADIPTDAELLASGRFNANGVDLNRNFDCKWGPESSWRGQTVSAGTGAFSEPEARAIRDYVNKTKPDAVVFWHSQANAVYASECENGVLSETLAIMDTYANAAGYQAVETFDAYPVTGDAEGWLASIGIPAVTVELATHESVEWEKNLAGVKSLFDFYSK